MENGTLVENQLTKESWLCGYCEVCGAPADVVYYDAIDATIDTDTAKAYLPGDRHVRCGLHVDKQKKFVELEFAEIDNGNSRR